MNFISQSWMEWLAGTSHLGALSRYAALFAVAMFGLAMLLAAWRLWRGPSTQDRILALDTLYVNAMAVAILCGIIFRTALYFEAALVIALLGFVGTVVMAKFIERGDIVQ